MPKRGLTEDYIPSWEEVKAKYRGIEIGEEEEKVPTWEEVKAKYASITPTEKTDISQTPTVNTPEMGQEPVQKQDMSIGKVIGGAWDSIKGFALNLSQFPKQFAGGLAEQVGEGRLIPRGLDAMAEQMYANAKKNPESISPEDFQQLEDKVFELRDKHLEQYSDSVFEDMHKWGKQALTESLEYVQNHPWVPKDDDKFGQFMFELGQGAASLTSALIVSILTKSPSAAAVMFGAYQSGSVYHEAREKGSSINEAYGSAKVSGMAEAALEKLGLDFMLKRFPGMNKMLQMGVKAASEALQEGSQTLSENTIAKLGYDTERDLMEGVGRSALMGAILGAGAETVLGKFMGDTKISEAEKKKLLAKTESMMNVINKHKDIVLMDAAQDKNLIKEIEAELKKQGYSFEAQDYMDAKQEIKTMREKGPVARPEIKITEPVKVTPGKVEPKAPVALSTEQLEKINKIIPEKNISKGNLELDKRKLKTPIKEIVSEYVPKEEQTKVEKNINEQINKIIPKTEIKIVESVALQEEIKEIIQDEINNEIEIYHFSPKKVDAIDPFFMGENLTQAEKERQKNDPVSEPTSAFYTRESTPEKQFVAGSNLYKVKVSKDKLLDIRLPENNKYITQEGNINETRIKNDGYLGYIAPVNKKAQVRIFESIPAQEVGTVKGSVKQGDSLKPMWNIKMKVEPKFPDVTVTQETTGEGETSPTGKIPDDIAAKILEEQNAPPVIENFKEIGLRDRSKERIKSDEVIERISKQSPAKRITKKNQDIESKWNNFGKDNSKATVTAFIDETNDGRALTREENIKRNEIAKDWIKRQFPNIEISEDFGGSYDANAEVSFMLTNITPRQARYIGRVLGQQTILTNEGLVGLNPRKDEDVTGKILPATDKDVKWGKEAEETGFFSVIKDKNGNQVAVAYPTKEWTDNNWKRDFKKLTKAELESADFHRNNLFPTLPAEKNINTRKETAQEVIQKRVVKFSEDVIVYNTQGKEVTLKKGHDYHIYPLEEDGKYRLQDGNQVTMYVGDIADLRDKIVDTAPGEVAGGGMMFPWEKAKKEKEAQQQEQEKEKLEDYPKEEGIEEKHTLSKRVYLATVAGDIEAGLTPENLSGYTKADMLSNAERAIDYVNKNYQKAVDMLMYGGEATDAQGHILKGGIFNAVKHIATKSGDVETLYDLALNSHVAREATFLGQQIKAFDEMGQYDAISAIRKLGQYKKEAASHRIKDLDSAKQKEIENIKSFMGIDIAKLREKLKSVFRNKDIYCG